MDLEILNIASDTDNNKNVKNYTHFSKLKNSLCGDEVLIKLIIKDEKIDKAIRSFPFPLSPPDNSFHIIDGIAGKALFFDPLLLHQGSNYGNRFP